MDLAESSFQPDKVALSGMALNCRIKPRKMSLAKELCSYIYSHHRLVRRRHAARPNVAQGLSTAMGFLSSVGAKWTLLESSIKPPPRKRA